MLQNVSGKVAFLSENCPGTILATKMLIHCSFLTKNLSSGFSELTKVLCYVLIFRFYLSSFEKGYLVSKILK